MTDAARARAAAVVTNWLKVNPSLMLLPYREELQALVADAVSQAVKDCPKCEGYRENAKVVIDQQAEEIARLRAVLGKITQTQPNNDPVVWAIVTAAHEALRATGAGATG